VRVVPVDPSDPREDRMVQAVAALSGGGVVALPTETFYGLAADAFNARAVERVASIKGTPASAPILLLIADPDQVESVAESIPEKFRELTELFWPGPLTLVVPAREGLPRRVTAGTGTVAVRVPGLALPRKIARALGRPITGPSANLHGLPPCRTAVEVVEVFGETLDLVLDGGPTVGGKPSTILDLSTGEPRVLREGLLPVSSLEPFLPELKTS
jgi:tRNA threonylcarbamoyl adenosine modification protein (Sua5/YciO/YrdC/YwlC family)